MPRQMKRYGVVIPTGSKVKVMVVNYDHTPDRHHIKSCLDFELAQELAAIQTRSSGWRTVSGMEKEKEQVQKEYKFAVLAIARNKYKIKELTKKGN